MISVRGFVFQIGGNFAFIERQNSRVFGLSLGQDAVWDIGIDQSTSTTGIALWDRAGGKVVMLEVHRHDNGTKEEMYRELFRILTELLDGVKVRHFIYERPVPSKWGFGSAPLLELKGRLESWIPTVPALENAVVDSLYPASWKKFVVPTGMPMIMDGGKKRKRADVKWAVASDVCKLFPEAENFYVTYGRSGDFDPFDALGIIYGYLKFAYTEEGYPKICGTEEKTHYAMVAYKYYSPEELRDPEWLQSALFGTYEYLQPVCLVYNTDYSFVQNIRKASSKYKCTVTQVPPDMEDVLSLRFGFSKQPGCVLIAFIFRKSALIPKIKAAIEIDFECMEEVYPND